MFFQISIFKCKSFLRFELDYWFITFIHVVCLDYESWSLSFTDVSKHFSFKFNLHGKATVRVEYEMLSGCGLSWRASNLFMDSGNINFQFLPLWYRLEKHVRRIVICKSIWNSHFALTYSCKYFCFILFVAHKESPEMFSILLICLFKCPKAERSCSLCCLVVLS